MPLNFYHMSFLVLNYHMWFCFTYIAMATLFSLDGTCWRLLHVREMSVPSGRLRHPAPLTLILPILRSSHLNPVLGMKCRWEDPRIYKHNLTTHSTITQYEACCYVTRYYNSTMTTYVTKYVTALTSRRNLQRYDWSITDVGATPPRPTFRWPISALPTVSNPLIVDTIARPQNHTQASFFQQDNYNIFHNVWITKGLWRSNVVTLTLWRHYTLLPVPAAFKT